MKNWKKEEVTLLMRYANIMTISELMRFFPDKSANAINAKIKRLRQQGKLGYKDQEAKERAFKQRNGKTE